MDILRAKVLLASGQLMPRMGLGTYQLQGSNVHKAIKSAIRLGYQLFDLSPGVETMARVGLSTHPRANLFLTIKVTHGTQEAAKDGAMKVLNALKLKYVDLIVLRAAGGRGLSSDDPQHKELRIEAWAGLEDLQRQGAARSLGVCDFTPSHLRDILSHCTIAPSVVQAEITPLNYDFPLLDFCKAHTIAVQAYSSLGNGRPEVLGNSEIRSIATEIGKSPCQVLLKWALQHGMCVIPRSRNELHQKENAEMEFDLSPAHMQQLNSLHTGFRTGWKYID